MDRSVIFSLEACLQFGFVSLIAHPTVVLCCSRLKPKPSLKHDDLDFGLILQFFYFKNYFFLLALLKAFQRSRQLHVLDAKCLQIFQNGFGEF